MSNANTTLEFEKQGNNESDSSFFDKFQSVGEAYDHCSKTIGGEQGLMDYLDNTLYQDHPGKYQPRRMEMTYSYG